MDQKLLSMLDGEMRFYPFALESKFPRILAQIMALWGKPGMTDYFTELMVCDREQRSGFPPEVAAEIMRLHLVYVSYYKQREDSNVWSPPNVTPSLSIVNSIQPKPGRAGKIARSSVSSSARWLHRAVEKGNVKAVSILLKDHADVGAADERGRLPLMMAAFHGHDELIKMLIEHRANVNARDPLGNTALHWATLAGKTSSAELLIASGGQPNACNDLGITPLHHAAANRQLAGVLALIGGGANPNLASNDGSTALHKAASNGHSEIVRALLRNGADAGIKNLEGSSPLTLAAKNGHKSVIQILRSELGPNTKVAVA
jgi:hypothetical protein